MKMRSQNAHNRFRGQGGIVPHDEFSAGLEVIAFFGFQDVINAIYLHIWLLELSFMIISYKGVFGKCYHIK